MRWMAALFTFLLACALAACQTPGSSTAPVATMPAAAAQAAPAAPATMAAPVVPLKPLVDEVTPGDDDGEKAHNQQGDNTETGDWTNRTYRHTPDGWFSWDLKVDPDLPNQLIVTYAGVDQRTFQLYVDGKLLSDQPQAGSSDDFYDQSYDLPAEMTKGKQKITVKFQSINGGYAGGVFGIRTQRVVPASKAP